MDNANEVNIVRYKQGVKEEDRDYIIKEKPLNIFVNNQYYATLMCTPFEQKELVVGFLFSEGIIKSSTDINNIEFGSDDIIFIAVNSGVTVKSDSKRAIISGCGRGIADINMINEKKLNSIISDIIFSVDDILKFMKDFNTMSELFRQTGGAHSSCICGNNGIDMFSEDIGRHNAIDKTIGKCIINHIDMRVRALFTTGRISSDSVIKTAKASIPIIVSHSGPTDLAVDLARKLNLTLIGFARGNRINIYSGFERIVQGSNC